MVIAEVVFMCSCSRLWRQCLYLLVATWPKLLSQILFQTWTRSLYQTVCYELGFGRAHCLLKMDVPGIRSSVDQLHGIVAGVHIYVAFLHLSFLRCRKFRHIVYLALSWPSFFHKYAGFL